MCNGIKIVWLGCEKQPNLTQNGPKTAFFGLQKEKDLSRLLYRTCGSGFENHMNFLIDAFEKKMPDSYSDFSPDYRPHTNVHFLQNFHRPSYLNIKQSRMLPKGTTLATIVFEAFVVTRQLKRFVFPGIMKLFSRKFLLLLWF